MKINIKKQFKFISTMAILLSFCILPMTTRAGIPNHINYQGKLKDDIGTPITAATTIQFSLYSDITNGLSSDTPSQAGPLLWTETYDQGSGNCGEITPGVDGIFAQQLGSCVSFPTYLDFTDEYYLGVKIGSDAEATPRVSFATNPYAFTSKAVHAENEDINIDTETSGDIVLNSAGNIQLQANDTTSAFIVNQAGVGNLFELQQGGTTSFIVQNNGFVGIGTDTPTQRLHVAGNMRLEGAFYDSNNQPGNNGYILSSTASGTVWTDAAALGLVDNLYTADGMLTGDRTLTANGYELIFNNNWMNFELFEDTMSFNGSDGFNSSRLDVEPYFFQFYAQTPSTLTGSAVSGSSSGGLTLSGDTTGVNDMRIVLGSDQMEIITQDTTFSGATYDKNYSANFVDRSLVDKAYVDSRVGTSIFDADADTGIQVEATPDDDHILMQTTGTQRFRIENNGRVTIGDNTSPSSSLLEVGGGAEPSVLAVVGDSAYLNIATFRDQDGENIFRAMGSLANNDLAVTFGDFDEAYTGANMSFNNTATGGNLTFMNSEIRFRESNVNTNYVGFDAPTGLTASQIWTLPDADGVASDVLVTDGAGALSWISAGTLTDNIYTADGTLTGDRIVDGNSNGLAFENLSWYYWGADNGNAEIDFDGAILKVAADNAGEFEFGHQDSLLWYVTPTVSDMAIRPTNVDTKITDARTVTKGLEYNDNYHSGYTDRSLVDKEYVDSNQSTLQQAFTSSIAADGYVYGISGAAEWEDDGGALKIAAQSGGYEVGMGDDMGSGIFFKSDAGVGNPGVILLRDNRALADRHGIEYDANYSVGFTPRSLVDKEYVDGVVTDLVFWTKVNDGGIDYLKPIATHNAITFGAGSDKGWIKGSNGMLEMGADVVDMQAISGLGFSSSQIDMKGQLRLDTQNNGNVARIYTNNLTSIHTFEFPDYAGDFVVTDNGSASVGDVLSWDGAEWVISSDIGLFSKNGTFIYNGGLGSNITTDDFLFGSTTMDYGTESNRMFFDKSKAAFRVGQAGGTEWDGGNVGSYSAAFGRGNRASGFASFVAGQYSNATAFGSIVIGNSATASGSSAVVIGGGNATGNSAVAMGSAIESPSFSEIALGRYSTVYTPNSTTTWDLNDRLFSIGNGIDGSNRSNALTILKNGKATFSNIAEYESDLAGSYTSRSFVDKEYVDSSISASYLANNGIINNVGTHELGGALNKNTNIDLNTFGLQFDSSNGYFKTTDDRTEFMYGDTYFTAEELGFEIEAADSNSATHLYIRPDQFEFSNYDVNTGLPVPTFHGVTYDVDYSANYTDRSLVDKGYVDSLLGSSLWQEGAGIMSPTNTSNHQISIINNSDSTLTGFKSVNTNDIHNYAGSVFEVKGSGPDYTNNMYFGKYGDNYYVNSWAGNGVMATDQDLILTSAGSSDITNPNADPQIVFQVGGGYTTPSDRVIIDESGLLIKDSSAAPAVVAGQSGIYSDSGELYAIDEIGNITQLSPHNEETNEWHYKSENVKTGKSLRVEMEQLVKDLDILLGGGYVFEDGEVYYDGEGDENIFNNIESSDSFVTQNDYIDLIDRIELLEEVNNVSEEISDGILTEIIDDVRNVLEEITFVAEVEFEEVVTFISEAIFTDEVMFMDRVTFGDEDVAGHAVIKEGEKEIEVKFEKEFTFEPYVTAVVNNEFMLFKVTDVTEEGFVIEIEQDAQKDIEFTWQTVEIAK